MSLLWEHISGTERCLLDNSGFATFSKTKNGAWIDYPRPLTNEFNYNMILNEMDNDTRWKRV